MFASFLHLFQVLDEDAHPKGTRSALKTQMNRLEWQPLRQQTSQLYWKRIDDGDFGPEDALELVLCLQIQLKERYPGTWQLTRFHLFLNKKWCVWLLNQTYTSACCLAQFVIFTLLKSVSGQTLFALAFFQKRSHSPSLPTFNPNLISSSTLQSPVLFRCPCSVLEENAKCSLYSQNLILRFVIQ